MADSASPISTFDALGFAADRDAIDRTLAAMCDERLRGLPATVRDAIRYSILGGGKRLRPLMLLAAYRAAGGGGDATLLASAIEVIHAYSLAHDDLPCMDDDDVRRGRPTLHRVFGEAVATVAGAAMVPLAAWTADDAACALGLPMGRRSAILREFMRSSGAGGMVGGQMLDLMAEGSVLTLAELEGIHRAKTGALIVAAGVTGGIAAGASVARLDALRRYGTAIGLAFQIADDVLDATSTTDTLGKTAGRDAERNKHTYPALLGVEGAIRHARELAEEGRAALLDVGMLSPTLDYLAHLTVARRS